MRTLARHGLWTALAATVALAACGGGPAVSFGTTTSTTAGATCTPGAQVSCACPGGSQGVQVCKSDGTGLEACACGDAGPGGDAGCTPKLYYLDADQDSYGGTDTMMACDPPGPTWVLQGGDCDDTNQDVHPGQMMYFPTPYDHGGSLSFDYDCDGTETRDPSLERFGDTPCYLMPGEQNCGPYTGYLPASPARSGPGVDPYCGSTDTQVCEWSCQVVSVTTTTPMGCR